MGQVIGDLTLLLHQWQAGDEAAMKQVTELVYRDLRRSAARFLNRERPEHTMQATDLVHEAFLKLRSARDVDWQSRRHFFGIMARMMRQILVDHARKRQTRIRYDSEIVRSIETGKPEAAALDLVALDFAIDKMAKESDRLARIVELRFFGGLSSSEVAEATGTSLRTVERDWQFARAWLQNELSGAL